MITTILTIMHYISHLQFDLKVRTNMRNMLLDDLETEQGIWNVANSIVSSKHEESDHRRTCV